MSEGGSSAWSLLFSPELDKVVVGVGHEGVLAPQEGIFHLCQLAVGVWGEFRYSNHYKTVKKTPKQGGKMREEN